MPYDDPEIEVHGQRVSLVERTARQLTDLSMKAEDGEFLGSEQDLLAAFDISRPTLRQAAKLVSADRMINVRKGQGGGFFATRPDAIDVIRAPARYLRLNGATIENIQAVTQPIAEEAVVAACGCSDSSLWERLTAFRVGVEAGAGCDETPETLIHSETELARLLATMSGNPAFELFIEIGYTFGRKEQNIRLFQTAEDRGRARELQRSVCDAVLARDPDIARLMIQRRARMIAEWLQRDSAR
ncbi:FadR/GntR family transcriptional regulator [Henriciella aquimarina]|uniref:FadR/GntR family transcriptional regulator n=1 Tax=Henriciella aquimarina TaxID=545261 RepID=UPI00117A72D8|nr:GntR family transcriptional regulator [Henriciella aquimarina]